MAYEHQEQTGHIEFLTRILAEHGVYQMTRFTDGRAQNIPFRTIHEMAEELLARDRRGDSVYHACAVYKDGTTRKASNAKAMKAFWLDIDCGDGKAKDGTGYGTKTEAVAALGQFCAECNLPAPMIVDSGGGLHIYWVLDEAIPASQWKPVAEKLKKLCSLSGFKADPSRTADAASILRPVGTHNRKYIPPRRVELLRDASAFGASTFEAALDSALKEKGPEATTKTDFAGGVIPIGRYVEPELVSEGGRNTAVLRHVGHLRGNGVAESLILNLARNFNAAKCVPPLDDAEVAGIVKTYASQGNPDPDEWPEPQKIAPILPAAPTFDFEMLPEVLKDFVRDASERMGVPPDYLAVPLMLSAAASLGSGWAVCPKANDKGWKESAVLWGGIVAPPGSKKSPCLQLAAKPLQRIEAKLAEKYRADKEGYDLQRRHEKSGGLSVLTMREPKQQRAIVNDVTYQKGAELCSTSAHGLLAQSDEVIPPESKGLQK